MIFLIYCNNNYVSRLHEEQGIKITPGENLQQPIEDGFAVVRAPTLDTNLTPETTTQKHVDAETKRLQRKKLLTKNPARKRRRRVLKNPNTETPSTDLTQETTTTTTFRTTEATTSMMMILPTRTGRRLGRFKRRKGKRKEYSTERINSREEIGSRRSDESKNEFQNSIETSTWKYEKDNSGFTKFENFTPRPDIKNFTPRPDIKKKSSVNLRDSFEMDVDARVRELTESIMKLREEIALLQARL